MFIINSAKSIERQTVSNVQSRTIASPIVCGTFIVSWLCHRLEHYCALFICALHIAANDSEKVNSLLRENIVCVIMQFAKVNNCLAHKSCITFCGNYYGSYWSKFPCVARFIICNCTNEASNNAMPLGFPFEDIGTN